MSPDRRTSIEAIDKEQSVTATQRLGQAVQPVREAKQLGDDKRNEGSSKPSCGAKGDKTG